MDKRWIYILIIAVIGITCLFFIAESSTTIGKATVKVGHYITTLPDSFNINKNGEEYAKLINRKTNERIFIKDLGKGNLIDDPGIIKAALTVGKGDRAAALQVCGYFVDPRHVRDDALGGENHVIIDVLALKRRQSARASGHIRKRHALSRNGDIRLCQHMNAVLRAAHAVPGKPVEHMNHPFHNSLFVQSFLTLSTQSYCIL